jgi:hypothetical protein
VYVVDEQLHAEQHQRTMTRGSVIKVGSPKHRAFL